MTMSQATTIMHCLFVVISWSERTLTKRVYNINLKIDVHKKSTKAAAEIESPSEIWRSKSGYRGNLCNRDYMVNEKNSYV